MPDVPEIVVEGPDPHAPRIEGVSTSTAGVVGVAQQGPAEPTLVASYVEFETVYGGAASGSHLGDALRGFFENGGRRAYVARAADAGAPALIAALDRLAAVDDVSLLVVPDESAARPTVADAAHGPVRAARRPVRGAVGAGAGARVGVRGRLRPLARHGVRRPSRRSATWPA